MTAAIEARGLSYSYGGPLVLDRVDLVVHEGEFVALVGPNGGGKSTLLRLVLGLLQPTAGEVRVFGEPPGEGRRHAGYCPQRVCFSLAFPITVEEVVMLGRLGPGNLLGRFTAADRAAAGAALEATGASRLSRRRIATLSGGELQRVLIARALAAEPRMLILDESTANIDHQAGLEIFELLRQINADKTIVVVSHDIGFVSSYVGRVACLNRTLEMHPTAALDADALARAYGHSIAMIEHAH